MNYNSNYIEQLKKDFPEFVNITEKDLMVGQEIDSTLEDFDRPEETLNEQELISLSAYYEYKAIEMQEMLKDDKDEYEFELEDLID
jgi:hypothetical protein